MAVLYPSKQIVFIFMVSVIVIGATVYYVNDPNNNSANRENNSKNNSALQSSPSDFASNDEWKKQFIESISTSSSKLAGQDASSEAAANNLTTSQYLGRQLFSQIMQMKEAGIDDPEVLERLTDSLAAAGINSIKPATEYDYSILNIQKSATDQDLYDYSNNLIAILKERIPPATDSENSIAALALEQENYEILERILPLITEYKQAIKDLTSMKVPEVVAPYHIELINGISIALNNSQEFLTIDKDPVKGMSMLASGLESIEKITSSYESIVSYVTDRLTRNN